MSESAQAAAEEKEVKMSLSGRFKDMVRRLAVTLFGVLELLGLPRIPEERDGKGGKGR